LASLFISLRLRFDIRLAFSYQDPGLGIPDSVGKPLSGGFFICAWYLLGSLPLVAQTFDHFARKLNLNWKFLTPACDNLKSIQRNLHETGNEKKTATENETLTKGIA